MPRSILEDLMPPLTTSLAAHHIRELARAAEAERRGASARKLESGVATGWRRSLGAGIQRLSVGLANVATSLDPPPRPAGHGVRRYGAE